MNEIAPSDGKLSSIIKAEAKIAMPEVVSVFISKYENELYERKATLSETIAQHNKDLATHEKTVISAADFSKYADIKVPKLGIVSVIKDEIVINWDEETITAVIGFENMEEAKYRRDRSTNFSKRFTSPISVKNIRLRDAVLKEVGEATSQLAVIISKIGDMSRKERQVKARISEMRLQEQGLEGFLQDKEMLKLIHIE